MFRASTGCVLIWLVATAPSFADQVLTFTQIPFKSPPSPSDTVNLILWDTVSGSQRTIATLPASMGSNTLQYNPLTREATYISSSFDGTKHYFTSVNVDTGQVISAPLPSVDWGSTNFYDIS